MDKFCRTALITGASRGIGRAIALKLASEGISVAINYNSSETDANNLVREIIEKGGKALAIKADVRVRDEVSLSINKFIEYFQSPIDLLICNAGENIVSKSFSDLEWQDFEQHLNVQLKGAFHCAKEVLGQMINEKFGKIVFINSAFTWGIPPAGWNHYTTAKYALSGFAKTLAVELGPKGICVNTISPGLTETDLLATMPDRLRKITASQIPLRRLCQPEDIAYLVAFLAKKDSSYLNGVDIPVSGGSVMR